VLFLSILSPHQSESENASNTTPLCSSAFGKKIPQVVVPFRYLNMCLEKTIWGVFGSCMNLLIRPTPKLKSGLLLHKNLSEPTICLYRVPSITSTSFSSISFSLGSIATTTSLHPSVLNLFKIFCAYFF